MVLFYRNPISNMNVSKSVSAALLKLKPLQLSASMKVVPACLPEDPDLFDYNYEEDLCVATGYGSDMYVSDKTAVEVDAARMRDNGLKSGGNIKETLPTNKGDRKLKDSATNHVSPKLEEEVSISSTQRGSLFSKEDESKIKLDNRETIEDSATLAYKDYPISDEEADRNSENEPHMGEAIIEDPTIAISKDGSTPEKEESTDKADRKSKEEPLLREVVMPVLNSTLCTEVYNTPAFGHVKISGGHICAGHLDGSASTCIVSIFLLCHLLTNQQMDFAGLCIDDSLQIYD